MPVPDDEKHVMYVWVDALTNYINRCRLSRHDRRCLELVAGNPHHRQGYRAVPRGLLAGLPDCPGGHRAAEAGLCAWFFYSTAGEKMSKSVGNVVDPFALIRRPYGLDQVRYFLLREVTLRQDGTYSHEAIVNRTNADLGQRSQAIWRSGRCR